MSNLEFVIVHGAYGNPNENWFPWLRTALEARGHSVLAPTLPTPQGQSLKSWREAFEAQVPTITERTVFVAHSLGPAFVLDVLDRTKVCVWGAFFLCGYVGRLGIPEFDTINAEFTDRDFRWEQLRTCARFFEVWNSDNDPYVPLARGQELARGLGVEQRMLSGAGHMNASAGFLEFPPLLARIDERTKGHGRGIGGR